MGASAPSPSSDAVSERMKRQKSRDTGTEKALRSELFRRGFRYRLHSRPLPGLRREADILNATLRLAIFVDGCFWHGCPLHVTWPKANAEFWKTKIEKNRIRDRDTDRRLVAAGWTVVRVWEHEDPEEAADRVMTAVAVIRANY